MGIRARQRLSEELAAEVRAQIERLGLENLTRQYIAERHMRRLSWPHAHEPTVEQSIEFPASREWAGRIGQFLRIYAQSRQRAACAIV